MTADEGLRAKKVIKRAPPPIFNHPTPPRARVPRPAPTPLARAVKETVDKAIAGPECACVTHVLVHRRAITAAISASIAARPRCDLGFARRRTGGEIAWKEGRDVWMHEAMERERPFAPAEPMGGEDPLFLLYTSGSTGKPKGT